MVIVRQWAADIALAAAATALSVALIVGMPELPDAVAALALVHTASLAVRRRWPVVALAVSLATAIGVAATDNPLVILGLAPLVVAYTVAAELPRRHGVVALALVEAALVASLLPQDVDASTIVGDAVALAAAWLFGDTARRRREVLALHRDRAEQLERTQAEVARRAVAEERLRIARELHDIVAHSMSVIAVQAASGRLVVDHDAARARQALVAIEDTSRSALDEMRRLLGVLRHDNDSDGDGSGREPAPGLDEVDRLVAQTAEAGVPVAMRVDGARRPLSSGAELTAFRVVQEALTNVRKHAPGARASVVLAYEDGGVRIEVTDDGGGRPSRPMGTDGHGLVGMRERVAVYGGEVEAAPLPTGGFRVVATVRDRP